MGALCVLFSEGCRKAEIADGENPLNLIRVMPAKGRTSPAIEWRVPAAGIPSFLY